MTNQSASGQHGHCDGGCLGAEGEDGVFPACGCPPALRDDTPHEGCLGEQSFKPSIFTSSQNLLCT